MLRAAEADIEGSLADRLIGGNANGSWLVQAARPLNPLLTKTRLINASYSLSNLENQLMLQWLLQETKQDMRLNLAEMLLTQEVQSAFDVIIIDAAPRLSTASINAICASHWLLVPTMYNSLAVETVESFLSVTRKLADELNPKLQLAGVVGNMTFGTSLTPPELDARSVVAEALAAWGPRGHIFEHHIPRKNAISNDAGIKVAYMDDAGIQKLFDELGDEVVERIGL